jgi:hypothetical protein
MQAQELLEIYDKAAVVIKQFYLQHMLESLNDENLPENFKDFVKEQGIDNDTVAVILTASPRMFFDVFDEHGIYINISAPKFSYSIGTGGVISGTLKTRKEAERAAIENAFQLLNDKL